MAPQAYASAPLYECLVLERSQGAPTLTCKWQPGGVEAAGDREFRVRRGGVWQTEAQALDA
jgi:hypothetical protein